MFGGTRGRYGRCVSRFRLAEEVAAMPWRPEDAPRHTKKANSLHLCELWSEVANKTLADTQDEARAVRIANAVVRRVSARRPRFEMQDGRNRNA
jgi:hypothetical protein